MLRTLIILTALLSVPVWAQDDLPDGPGKAATERICTSCHGAEMFSGEHKSGDDWDRTISSMQDKGATLSDAEYSTVLDYLTKNMGPIVKVNVNTATADQIQKGLSITAAQAAAIVAYRTKNGNFKDLDSVKKVDGTDAAALDAKKAYISF